MLDQPHPERVRTYRARRGIEAMRWEDTDEMREQFTEWFDQHDTLFETRGGTVVLPEPDLADPPPRRSTAAIGEWVIYADGRFLVMRDTPFTRQYEETSLPAPALSTKERALLTNLHTCPCGTHLSDALPIIKRLLRADAR